MSRRRIGSVLLCLAALLAPAATVQASEPRAVSISVLTQTGDDPFESTGGVVCAEGTVSNDSVNFVGWQSGTHAQIQVVKHFECADGSFDIHLRAVVDFATCDTVGTWSVRDGSGAYERLHGSGSLTGTSECDDSILDVYTGRMHFD